MGYYIIALILAAIAAEAVEFLFRLVFRRQRDDRRIRLIGRICSILAGLGFLASVFVSVR